jgi:hypothetical protein
MSEAQVKATPKQKAIAAICKRYEDDNDYKWPEYVNDLYDAGQKDANDKLLEALKELVRVVGGTLQGYGILESPMRAAEAAIHSVEEQPK